MASHLGHVHLRVRDIERAVEFYTEVFGLETTELIDRYAFLSFGEHHHDVALQEVGENASGPGTGVGLYHAAFEVEDDRALGQLYETLQRRGVVVSPVDHGISKALYFEDPSGNGLEAYVDTRDTRDEGWEMKNESFDPERLSE